MVSRLVVEAKKGLIHMEMVVECPLVITPKVKPFSRPNQEFGIYLGQKTGSSGQDTFGPNVNNPGLKLDQKRHRREASTDLLDV